MHAIKAFGALRPNSRGNGVTNSSTAYANRGHVIKRTEHLNCPICYDNLLGEIRPCENGHRICSACLASFQKCPQCRAPLEGKRTKCGTGPLWKRRGAKPIANLVLNPVIRGDISWDDKAICCDELLDIVSDSEWKSLQPNYFEVHSMKDIKEGVVINPPTYSGWYTVPSLMINVPAVLPRGSDILLRNALSQGFYLKQLVLCMAGVVGEYSMALIHRKRRSFQEILIVARQHSWQGASAIAAATRLLTNKMLVSVLITDSVAGIATQEEFEFIEAGGAVYKDIKELAGRKYKVVVMAMEDQYSARRSDLPKYGEFLQHAVAIFVDPPILKCSYTTALQIATKGCYNMCQKTILLTPFLPKPYVPDNFVELIVVDGGISDYTQRVSGIPYPIFPRINGARFESVVPVEFAVKGSRLYFYNNDNDERVPC